MSTCPEQDMHSVYLDGELPQKYALDYESHLTSCQRCREVIVGRWLLLTHGIISAADNTCREVSKSIVPVVGASVYYMVPKGISVMHSPEGGMHDEMLLDDMLAAVLGRHTPQHDVVACHWA